VKGRFFDRLRMTDDEGLAMTERYILRQAQNERFNTLSLRGERVFVIPKLDFDV
jgi:hypothetical protein